MKKIIIFLNMLLIMLFLCACGENPSGQAVNTNDTTFVEEEISTDDTSYVEQDADVNDTTSVEHEETLREKILNTIEGEYEKDSEKDEYLTTAGMIELAGKYAEKWEEVSAEYYNKIITASGDKKGIFKDKLDKLKIVYDEYEKNNLDMKSEIYDIKYQSGSMGRIAYAGDYYELRKNYALDLIGMYEMMTLGME